MKKRAGIFLCLALFASPLSFADSPSVLLRICVQQFIEQTFELEPDADELVAGALVACADRQQAYSEFVIVQLLALDVPPRRFARGLAHTEGVRAALGWGNESVAALQSAI